MEKQEETVAQVNTENVENSNDQMNDSGIMMKSLMESFQQSQFVLMEKMFEKFEANQRDLLQTLQATETRGTGSSFRSSTPRSSETFYGYNFQPSSIRMSSDRCSTPYRPFAGEIRVIEQHKRSRRPESSAPSQQSSRHGNTRTDNVLMPHLKMPVYEGKEEIDVFFTPFERLAGRGGWGEHEKIDRLYQCLKGPAMRYLCTLPREVCANYSALKGSLINRFGRREPPTTVRRKLSEIKQHTETNEEFAEEVRRLITRAYPGVGLDMQDQLAAESFLKGYRNSKIAYEVMNKNPATLNEALDLVTFLEHNYKATLGREEKKERTRRVSWQDEYPDNENEDIQVCVNRLNQGHKPTYVTMRDLDERLKKIEEILRRKDFEEKKSVAQQRSRSPSIEKQSGNYKCFNCGGEGHFSRECRSRPRSPSPKRNFVPAGSQGQQLCQNPVPGVTKSIKITHLDSDTTGIMIEIGVNNTKAIAVVDTGADATIISDGLAKEAGITIGPEAKTFKLLNAKDGSEMTAYGGVTATIHIANR